MEVRDLVPEIKSDRNYWLVRTEGGKYFQEFFFENYIGINWDYIDDIQLMSDEAREDELTELIKKLDVDEKMPRHAARQIRKFVSDMRKGDIVIIPSENSDIVAFGEILEDNIYFEEVAYEDLIENKCPFKKRRKVKWLKYQKRAELDPYLFSLLYSHHTITNANDYAVYIDRTLSNFYIKDNEAHFILRVNEKEKIRAVDFLKLINNTISILDDFNRITGSNLNKDNVDLKVNVQSPGPIHIFGNIEEVVIIGIIGIIIVGGGFKFRRTKEVTEAEITSDGLIDKIIKFIDHLHNNKVELIELENRLKEPVNKLNVEVPKVPTQKSILKQLSFFEESAEEIDDETIEVLEIDKKHQDKNKN